MFGRFLELAIPTRDILASVQFYDSLGFSQLTTGDAWPHRYGVLGDGRIVLGLHEYTAHEYAGRAGAAHEQGCPAPAFVLPDLEHARTRLHAAGIEPQLVRLDSESLHHLWLRDPGGNEVILQEARTFSPQPPPSRPAAGTGSLCGYFQHLSVPESDFDAARDFWERAGFVALPETHEPYAHLPLTSDALDLAFHRHRSFDAPLLVFEYQDAAATRAALQQRGIASALAPRGIAAAGGLLLQAPEGTALLLVQA